MARLGPSVIIGLISVFVATIDAVKAQMPEFQSIDCGSKSAKPYYDSNGIWWMPDVSTFVAEGEGATAAVQAPDSVVTNSELDVTYSSIRYFPGNQTKYCYELSSTQDEFYLVRAGFWLGSKAPYNPGLSLVRFKLLINADEWDTVSTQLPQSDVLFKEIYLQATSDHIYVCLSGAITGNDVPFISSIELRPLSTNMTSISSAMDRQPPLPLTKVIRTNYGAPPGLHWVRFGDDIWDRIWDSDYTLPTLSTSEGIVNGIDDVPPKRVLQTALVGQGLTGSINISIDVEANKNFHYALYYSEIDGKHVNGSNQRVFNVLIDGDLVEDRLDVYNQTNGTHGVLEHLDTHLSTSTSMTFQFVPVTGSLYPAFISAIELLQFFDKPMSTGTYSDDAP